VTVQLTKEQVGLIHQREDEDEEPGEVTFQTSLCTSGTEPGREGGEGMGWTPTGRQVFVQVCGTRECQPTYSDYSHITHITVYVEVCPDVAVVPKNKLPIYHNPC